MAIQKTNKDKYLFKIVNMGIPEDFNSLDIIYNLYVVKNSNGEFVFQNTISENLKKWKTKIIENITYYYSENRILNDFNINKQIDFEDYITEFLDVKKIDYKFIVC